MLFADELRDPKGIPAGAKKRPSKKALEGAVQLIEALSTEWDPEAHKDRYRAACAT